MDSGTTGGNRLPPLLPDSSCSIRPFASLSVSLAPADELEDAFREAREVMDRQIVRDIKFDIGGDRQRVEKVETDVKDVTFKHILIPVWIAAYKYRGKSYRFVVNGQTGSVAGERPWSVWKIAFAVTVAMIVAATVGYFYAMNQ